MTLAAHAHGRTRMHPGCVALHPVLAGMEFHCMHRFSGTKQHVSRGKSDRTTTAFTKLLACIATQEERHIA